MTMKRFLAFVLIAALGVFTIGCERKTGTTENKTQTTTTQTKDGKITGETTTTTTDTTNPPGNSGGRRADDRDDDQDDQVVVVMGGWLAIDGPGNVLGDTAALLRDVAQQPLGKGVANMGGKTDVVKGPIKEAAGALTGNDELREEGKTDEVVGKTKQAVQKAADTVEKGVKEVRE